MTKYHNISKLKELYLILAPRWVHLGSSKYNLLLDEYQGIAQSCPLYGLDPSYVSLSVQESVVDPYSSMLDGAVIDVNLWRWLGLTLTKNTSHWCQMVNEHFLVIARLHQDGSYTVGWLKTQVLRFGFPRLRMYCDLVEGF